MSPKKMVARPDEPFGRARLNDKVGQVYTTITVAIAQSREIIKLRLDYYKCRSGIKRKWLFILPLILFCKLFFAQPQPAYKHYSTEEGLPSSEIYQVIQDKKGYIWFATDAGVSRFNGYEFENFTTKDGLPDNTVFEIFEDSKGRIWFLPLSCMLSYYEDGKITAYEHNDTLKKLIKNPIKTSFTVDSKDNVHLGVLEFSDRIIVMKNGTVFFNKSKLGGDPFCRIYKVREVEGKLLWTVKGGDDGSPVKFDINTSHFNCMMDVMERMPIGGVAPCILTKEKKIIKSYSDHLYVIKNCQIVEHIEMEGEIISLLQEDNSDVWVGTAKKGVSCYPKGNFKATPLHFWDGLSVTAVVKTKEGGYWFSTLEKGAFYISSKYYLTYNEATGLLEDKVNTLTTDGDAVYAGLPGGMIYCIKEDRIDSIDVRSILKGSILSSLFYDTIYDNLWFTCGFLNKGKTTEVKWISGSRDLTGSRTGTIWTGNYGFLCWYDNKPNRRFFKRIDAVEPGENNIIWLGCPDGLWEYKIAQDKFVYHGKDDSLLSKRILDIKFMQDTIMCLATKGHGVMFRNGKTIYTLKQEQGLSSENVKKLYIEKNDIWACTDQGINKITIHSFHPFSCKIKIYTTKDGLASNETNDILKLGNKVWVATAKGLTTFDESEISESSYTVPVYITSVNVNNKEARDSFPVEYNEAVRINYTGVSSRDKGDILYRYRLEGLDTSWIVSKAREVRFAGLSADNYQFTVQAANEKGIWGSPASISFNVHPPYWGTWWFRGGIAASIIGIIILIFISREKKIRKKEAEKNRINKETTELQMKALRAQMNPHFTFNVMNSIQRYILNNDSESAQHYLSRFSRLLRIVLDQSEYSTISLAEELKGLNLYMELESMRFTSKFAYSVEVDKNIDPTQILIPSMLIQPHVENAIKHGLTDKEGKGIIRVHISQREHLLVCSIEDNGIGREKAKILKEKEEVYYKSMGTYITDQRIELLNKNIGNKIKTKITDIKSEDGSASGTKIEISIPLSNTKN